MGGEQEETKQEERLSEGGFDDDDGDELSILQDTTNKSDSKDNNNNLRQSLPATKLYKSTRLKGYMTLALASFISYDSAENSANVNVDNVLVVSSKGGEQRYAVAVALLSLILSSGCLVVHLDRFTPLQPFWASLFCNGSKVEGALIAFLTVWWSVCTGVSTSVSGLAGDGRGQYSLYYSCWVCALVCFWMLERWWVAAGWSSFQSFISSWPHRSPAWLCIMILSFFTLIWYLDLWKNHKQLNRVEERLILEHFRGVSQGQWQWLIVVTVVTFLSSIVFVSIELFRETKPDGTIQKKSHTEVVIEGICFLFLDLAWIPTVVIATTPRGAASLIGNSYFFTWALTIFVTEGLIWFIHDKRKETHDLLKQKEAEYQKTQKRVLHDTQRQQMVRQHSARERASTEFFDADETRVRRSQSFGR